MLPLPSKAVVALFHSIDCCLPPDPGIFAKKLLDVFFSEEKLARSCCTKAVGRELLDQDVLCGIKCKLSIMQVKQYIMLCVFCLLLIDQTSYKYHIPKEQLGRTCRRKLAEKQEKME